MPGYLGPHDALGLGAGGVWFGGTFQLPPTVWQVEWPEEVKQLLISDKNPKGKITNSDLECVGFVLAMLVLAALIQLNGVHLSLIHI